jgi:hypothetical protein
VGGLARNSYAVPTEVGKVGTESPMLIEPVQNRKDGIKAMFSRQAKAARDAPPPPAAAAIGKRKREPSSSAEEMEEVKDEMGTSASSAGPSPSKRSIAKEHPIKVEYDPVDSDTETLRSLPSSVRPHHLGFIARETTLNSLPTS